MTEQYDHRAVELHWQSMWEQAGSNRTISDLTRPKWYALTMLPYPSGDLHAGHWYAMTPSDAAARFRRMQGYNTFFPVGFDAFGLPAENAAIKHNLHPKQWTYQNIDRMRKQLQQMGAMWAWDHEVITCDPDYYKWTQWFFLRLYEAGLAYREFAPVDWCPSCNTTLAREQVVGLERICERCDSPVIKKELNQWKFRITQYAEELLNELPALDWPERVKVMQTNWIGRSEGAEIVFAISDIEGVGEGIRVFTTRPDTLWGATFLVLAPEHPLVATITPLSHHAAVASYTEAAGRLDERTRTATDKEKTGVFTGAYAKNPATGELIPIWIADYVLMGYGTGAIMAVPGHDERDYAFAKTYGLPIVRVIEPPAETVDRDAVYSSKTDGTLIHSGEFSGTPVAEAIPRICRWIEEQGIGKRTITYRLRDWLISRQRMWGTPIPIVHCSKCGVVPTPYEQLPVTLPDDASFKPTGESPLKYHSTFRNVPCPKCGGNAERETDTMDTFVCSSWYQYGYISPYWKRGAPITRDDTPWNAEEFAYWAPVDQYTGGIEHATMHLLYTRFFSKALRDLSLFSFSEPMTRLVNQGMVLGPDNEKMSKSRGNVVNPDDYVRDYGADTVRGYLMFLGPWEQGGPWDPSAIEGVSRFLNRVWRLMLDAGSFAEQGASDTLIERRAHQLIIRATEGLEEFRFNTVIAGYMEFSNLLSRERSAVGHNVWQFACRTLLTLMAPIFPHITEELWHRRGETGSIHVARWPEADRNKAQEQSVTIVIQVNGKLRGEISAAPGTPREILEATVRSHPAVARWCEGKEIRKVIVVPDKLVNVVI